MRFTISFLSLCIILPCALPVKAQRSHVRSGRPHRVEQRDFYLDEPFKRPVKIPESVIQLLRQDIGQEKEQACRRMGGGDSSDIASWFSASSLNLNDDRRADLIVKSGKGCLNGADNDWFWIFLNTGRGYRLVLFGGTLDVGLLKTRTHGLHDIETNVATASINFGKVYKFDGREYQARVCTEASPVTAKPKRVPCSEN
jgi:hypothetical protein